MRQVPLVLWMSGTGEEIAMPPMKRKKPDEIDRAEIFDIICFYMGQGDCTLIRCPDGKMVMIDCGSTAGFATQYVKIVGDAVRHPDWAGGNGMVINALILTHTDADHHNQVVKVLGATTLTDKDGKTLASYKKLAVDQIYFSWSPENGGPLKYYKAAALNKNVYNHYFSTSQLYDVTIGRTGVADNCKKWFEADGFKAGATGNISGPGRRQVLFSGTTPKGKAWRISLIAGNVTFTTGAPFAALGKDESGADFYESSTEPNARSLITLLEIGAQKALFCGDATFSTENLLVTAQSDLISNPDLVLAPHHGSEAASSTAFTGAVKAKRVVVSAGLREHKHKHPRATSLQRWIAQATPTAASHDLDYWVVDGASALSTWGAWTANNLAFDDNSDTFRTLKVMPSGGNPYGCLRFFGLLYRVKVTTDVRATALQITGNPKDPMQFLNYKIGND
jgi:beta-lactamase superfamily II metal-dependent hydrolase